MKIKNNFLKIIFVTILIIFTVITINILFVSVFKYHLRSGTDLKPYVDESNLVENKIIAKRGNILDRNGIIVAQDIVAYDIIAILDKNRISNGEKIAYVDDPLKTAKILADILKAEESELFALLSKQGVYQTELGIYGKGISKEVKEKIEEYKLNGIEFRSTRKRNYPLTNFAPYIVGYAQANEKNNLIGKMGVEYSYNSYLTGEDGYESFQADKDGYILPGMKKEIVEAKDGNDLYLTIDKGIQEALNIALEESVKQFGASDVWASVAEVDTGRILAWGQYPSFDNNILEIKDYTNKGSQYTYEPGSVFKSIVYVAAMDLGTYNGNNEFNSESFCYISDSNGNPTRTYGYSYGCVDNALRGSWGSIPIDDGLIRSSNVATSTLLVDYVGVDNFYEYVKKFGFFDYVDTDGVAEEIGQHNYEWASEKLNMTFGHAISTTMLHIIQAYTAMFGNGDMIKPYFVEKIVNSNGEVVYNHQHSVVNKPISEASAKTLQELMGRVVSAEYGTGQGYSVEGVDIIAKTGTSQIALPEGGYDSENEIASVIIGFPADKPKYMLYYATKAHFGWTPHYTNHPVTNLLKKVTKILEVNYKKEQIEEGVKEVFEYKMPNLVNTKIDKISEKLNGIDSEVVILGNGKSVIDQLPKANDNLYSNEKIFLLTSYNDIKALDFSNWSRKEITDFWSITNLNVVIKGQGLVVSQSILTDTIIQNNDILEVVLSDIYKEKQKEESISEEGE